MKNIENLEDYIREEIGKVDVGDADEMWNDFKSNLKDETNQVEKINEYKILFVISASLLVISLLVSIMFYNKSKMIAGLNHNSEAKQEEVRKKSVTKVLPKGSLQESLYSDKSDMKSSSTLKYDGSNFASFDSDENDTTQQHLFIDGAHSGNTKSNTTINKERSAIILHNARDEQASYDRSLYQPNQRLATVNEVADRDLASDQGPTKSTGVQSYEARQLEIENDKASQSAESSMLELLPKLNSYLIVSEVWKPIVVLSEPKDLMKSRNKFISVQSNFAKQRQGLNWGFQQHSISYGQYFKLNRNFDLKAQLGLRYDLGYSLIQDSIITTVGLQIIEHHKNKDLKELWQGLLKFEMVHRRDKMEFGFGTNLTYAIRNKFRFSESSRAVNNVSENTMINKDTYYRQGSWTGVNRLGVEAYLNLTYWVNDQNSIGLLIGRRMNPLVKEGKAEKALSNTLMHNGIYFNRHF